MSAHYARTPVGAYASPHAGYGAPPPHAASPYLSSAHASPVVDEGAGGSNFAGFGARKFAEKQRRAADAARAHAERDAQQRAHAEWQRRQYERELARYEDERRAHDDEERMRWEEHAAWQAAERRAAEQQRARDEWEREEAERQHLEAQQRQDDERRRREEQDERRRRDEHAEAERRRRVESEERRQRADSEERRRRAESDERRRAADEHQRRAEATAPSPAALQRNDSWAVLSSNDAWARNAAAVAAYDANRESGTHAAARVPPMRSATLDSVSSSAHLAYGSERESSTAHSHSSSSGSSASSRTLNRSGSSETVPSSCSSRSLGIGLGIAASRAPRETIYEDDFEEADSAGESDADVTLRASKSKTARYTQYGGDALDLLDVSMDGIETHGLRASKLLAPRPPSPPVPAQRSTQGGRRSMVRATTYEPLPKAKCADCGESLAFEDLVAHTCSARLDDGALSPLPPGSGLNSPLPPRSGLNTPLVESPTEERTRSPFFDRYARLEPKSSSPAPPEGAFSAASRSRSRDEMPSPRTVEDRRRANTSPLATPLPLPEQDTAAAAAAVAQALIVADRKRHIEAQRQAARNGGAGRTATTVAAALRLQTAPAARSPSKALSPLDTDSCSSDCSHKRDTPSASSSVSSVCSSLLGAGRDGAKASRSPGGADMTPSSSYGRFSDREARDKEPATKLRSSPAKGSPMLGRRPEIDLGGIEDLMAGLISEEPSAPVKRGAQRERSGTGDSARRRPAPLKLDSDSAAPEPRQRKDKLQRLCSVCLCSLSTSKTPFVERDGRLLCAADYAELYLPKCRKCTKPVERQAVKSSDGALRGIFHRACFCCFQCDAVFADGTFYVFENAPYCARHYHTLNGTLCHGCGDGIEGQCRQTEAGERYHPRCLTCQYEGDDGEFCAEALDDFFIIGERRLCEWHARKTQAALEKGGRSRVKATRRQTILQTLR